jgi:hypothetical protein
MWGFFCSAHATVLHTVHPLLLLRSSCHHTSSPFPAADALVTVAEATEEKAAAVRHRVMVAHQLLDEEQVAATDLERQTVVAKNLVLGSTSSSTTEPATNSSLYEDTVVANLHIQTTTVSNVRSLMIIVLDATPGDVTTCCWP